MKYRNMKRFTLVEVLIALSLSAVVMTLSGLILVEYMNVYKDLTAEYHLSTFANNLKSKLELGVAGGLREAVWESVTEDESGVALQYETISDINDGNSTVYNKNISQIKEIADNYVLEYNNDPDVLDGMSIDVVNIEIDVVDNGEVTLENQLLFEDEKLVALKMDIQYNISDKSYNYRFSTRIPIKNNAGGELWKRK